VPRGYRRYQPLVFSGNYEIGSVGHGIEMPIRLEDIAGRYGFEDLHDEGRKILGQ
jgi:hypothetical protein